jgi:OOP family OmpA-OmpF porin
MKKITLGILLTSCALPVLAESNLSAEFLVGSAEQESSIESFDIISDNDLSLGIRAALKVTPNIAFELAYQDYGTAEDSYTVDNDTVTIGVSSSAVNVGVKGIIPFENGLSLNGRIGLSLWDAEFEASALGETGKTDDNDSDLYYGLGLQYNISPELMVGVEYAYTDMDVSLEGVSVDHEVNNLSLSLGYKF